MFEGENGLTHSEFLFFVSNASDRADIIHKKLPHGRLRTDKDLTTDTYNFDVGLEHSRAPDAWLQEITNPMIDVQLIMFEHEDNSKPAQNMM